MRKLSIKLTDNRSGEIVCSIIADHLSITERCTTLFWNENNRIETLPAAIDNWFIINGVITINYKSGFHAEITRIA